MTSCNEEIVEKPTDLISEDEMVNILYDIAIVKAHSNFSATTNRIKKRVFDFPNDYIFEKYQIDSAQLSQSNIYYSSKSDQHIRIFTKVLERIESEKNSLAKEKDSLNPKTEKIKPVKEKRKSEKDSI